MRGISFRAKSCLGEIMLKPLITAAVAATVCMPCVSLAAGPYFGASGLYAERPAYSNVDGSFGGKIYAGYRFSSPVFVEASYLDTGKADVNDTAPEGKLKFSGYTLGAGWFAELSPSGSGYWVRGAYYNGDSQAYLDGYSGSVKQSTSGVEVGAGGQWKFNDWVGLRFEYEVLIQPKDFSDNENLDLLSLGLVFEFPTASATRPASRASSSSEPFTYPAGYVPPAADAASVAPDATATAAEASAEASAPTLPTPNGSTTAAAPERALKTQPRMASQTELMIPMDELPAAGTNFSNPEGDWRFVEYHGQTGWVLVSPAR